MEEVYEFPELLAAIKEAKQVLAEMTLDGVAKAPGASITVEVVNAARIVGARVDLTSNNKERKTQTPPPVSTTFSYGAVIPTAELNRCPLLRPAGKCRLTPDPRAPANYCSYVGKVNSQPREMA